MAPGFTEVVGTGELSDGIFGRTPGSTGPGGRIRAAQSTPGRLSRGVTAATVKSTMPSA